MNPVFLNIGGFTIAWYGVLITLGVAIGYYLGRKMAKERGLNVELFEHIILWIIVWGIVGARIVFVVTSWNLFANTAFPQVIWDIINIRQGGISIHGGLLGGILALIFLTRRHNINFYHIADLCIPGVAFGIIGGRLGNIMNGTDTIGRVTDWPVGFVWPTSARAFHEGVCQAGTELAQYCNLDPSTSQMVMSAPVHFTQMYGVIIGIILSVASFFWLRSKIAGWVFWQFWLWYSILRAGWEETFRLNPLSVKVYLDQGTDAAGIGFFTSTQIVSIPIIIASMWMLFRLKNQAPEDLVASSASLSQDIAPNPANQISHGETQSKTSNSGSNDTDTSSS